MGELARIERAEERKMHYKKMARQFYYEMNGKLEKKDEEFTQIRHRLDKVIEEQEGAIKQL